MPIDGGFNVPLSSVSLATESEPAAPVTTTAPAPAQIAPEDLDWNFTWNRTDKEKEQDDKVLLTIHKQLTNGDYVTVDETEMSPYVRCFLRRQGIEIKRLVSPG